VLEIGSPGVNGPPVQNHAVAVLELEAGDVKAVRYVMDDGKKKIYVILICVREVGTLGVNGPPVQRLVVGVLEADQEPVSGDEDVPRD